jgi:hypothetical protein
MGEGMSLGVNFKQNRNLILLFAGALILRLLFYVFFLSDNPLITSFDSGHYHQVALQIEQGKGIANANGSAHFYRLPGYPLFLAGCYKICGADPKIALLVQIVLASLIPLLIFFLSLAVFPARRSVAWLAAIVSSIHVGFLIYSGLLMTETLFLVFFLLFLIAYFSGCLFSSGVLLGIASLIRPVGLYVIILSIVLLMLQGFNLKKIGLLLGGWLIIVIPWLVRNYLLTGALFFHTLPGTHFLNHMAIPVVMQAREVTQAQARAIVMLKVKGIVRQQEKEQQHKLSEYERSVVMERVARDFLKKYPVLAIKHSLLHCFKTTFALYSSELLVIDSGGKLPSYDSKRSVWDMIKRFLDPHVANDMIVPVIYFEILLFALLMFGVGGYAITSLLACDNLSLFFTLVAFVKLFVIVSCACGFARLRLPIEPILIMVSSKFWIDFFSKKRES